MAIKKAKTKIKATKQDFSYNKKVSDNSLDWCPLFGYMPEVFDTHLQKIPIYIPGRPIMVDHNLDTDMLSIFDVAFDCRDFITEAREYWGIAHEHCDLVKDDPFPEIKILPTKKDSEGREYEYRTYNKKKCNAARMLFQNVHRIAWGDDIWRSNIDSCNQYSSTRLKNDIFDINLLDRPPEILLSNTQGFIGENYKISLDEIYSLYAIYESLHLMVNLLNEKYTQEDHDIVFNYLSYIEKLLDAAAGQKEKKKLIYEKEESDKIAVPVKKRQSYRGKRSGEVRRAKGKDAKKSWINEAENICKKYFEKSRTWMFINDMNVAKRIIKNLSLNEKQFNTIRQDKGVKGIVDKYRKKMTAKALPVVTL
jgi:hypothetical protein